MRRIVITLAAAIVAALAGVGTAAPAWASQTPQNSTLTFLINCPNLPPFLVTSPPGLFATVGIGTPGQPARLLLDEHWTGTGTANGKYVIEHAAQNNRWISSAAPQPSPARSTTRSRSAASSSTTAGSSASTATGTSRSRPARTRDSTVTPPRFRSSAQHCPDLKQASQAKLQRAL